MKIYELLSTPNKWIRGYIAQDEFGRGVSYDNPNASRWCLLGALYKCYTPPELNKIFTKLVKKICKNVSVWNDESSYEQVINILKELDI